jgi:MOSC domain-containing protein YiiM
MRGIFAASGIRIILIMTGQVIAIYISAAAEDPMQSVAEARLETGRGIVGDRYYRESGTFSEKLKDNPAREVTLVESEQIAYYQQTTGMPLGYGTLRRNIVTGGIDLNALVGRRFRIGEVIMEGVRLCEPCAHIARLVAEEVLTEMVHRAGLRAAVVSDGTVRVADSVVQSGS